MDDLLEQFKQARRVERDLRERVGQQTRDGAYAPDWTAYMDAVRDFDEISRRLADYLLGVEGR